MIQIKNLHKTYDDQAILKGVDLTINKGETLALIGPSGEGKSVLLKQITGLQTPDKGEVLIDHQDVHRLHGKKLKTLKDRIGIVFQFGALFDSLSIYDNIAFPLREKTKLKENAIREKIMKALKEVNLEGHENKFPSQISGGMRKRVALARCLIMNPEVIFFDEPTTGLDPVITQSIYGMIKKLNNEYRLTSLIVSHEIPKIFDIVDRAAMLHDGKIIAVGTPAEIQASDNNIVQKFLNGGVE